MPLPAEQSHWADSHIEVLNVLIFNPSFGFYFSLFCALPLLYQELWKCPLDTVTNALKGKIQLILNCFALSQTGYFH